MAHKRRHQALGVYDNNAHHTDYIFRQFTSYFPVKSEECGDQTWEVLVINVCSWPNKSSDVSVLCSKLVLACPFTAWSKQEVCVRYLYWSPELKIIWEVSPSAGKIHCHFAMLLTDVIDCSSYCLHVSLKQLILAQWDRMSYYIWDSQNEWLHGIVNYVLSLLLSSIYKGRSSFATVRRDFQCCLKMMTREKPIKTYTFVKKVLFIRV